MPQGRSLPRGQDGAILIIAIGVLTLLAVLGATFANLMRLEKQATQNYVYSQEVDLINDSALDSAIAELKSGQNWYSFSNYKATWLHKIRSADSTMEELAHGIEPLDSDRTRPWAVIAERQNRTLISRYKVKIIDTSAQINLNGKQDSLAAILDNLGVVIRGSTRINSRKGSTPSNPLHSEAHDSGSLIRGEQILTFRNKLEGNKFHSKTQLRELIGQENFEIIKDFVTTDSWEDPYTYKADDGLNVVIDAADRRLGGGSGLGGGAQFTGNPVEITASPVSPEARSPININTAPEEVLTAVIMGIGARRPFPYSYIKRTPIDESATISGQRILNSSEERDNLAPRAVWIYTDRTGGLDINYAHQIALRIIAVRKNNPFYAWSSGDTGTMGGGFAEFINQLTDSQLPPPAQAVVIDPRMPQASNRIAAEILHGAGVTPALTLMWNRGNDSNEQSIRRQTGMAFHRNNAFYYDLVKSAIISNFNPNTRINTYNPNAPAYIPVDKSQLVKLDKDGRTPRKGHTTEFCFDTNGIYEITTLGEISEITGPMGSTTFRPIYQKPVRTVVKIFDVLRHTNQFHFEKTFVSGQRSSRGNRRFVMSFPDAMTALTDAVTLGSHRDGNVQLAGLNDGRRLLMPASQRIQSFRAYEGGSIAMAIGFQDRDENSYGRLLQLNRTNSPKEMLDQMRVVLDANYSRLGGVYQKNYSDTEQTALAILGNVRNAMPLVDIEQMGTDLFPDGFHQSIYTSTMLGGRFIYLPCHQKMGSDVGTSKGGSAAQVGAGFRKDLNGNVPYYQGGLAFWVKFEFNGDDPVFSGLIGATSVIEDVGMTPKNSEGTQFYVFKNTEGWLRVVRMYYHQAFPEGGSGDSGGTGSDSGSVTLWPPVTQSGDGSTGGTGSGEAPVELDPRKVVARADYMVDVKRFRAHDWHHIAVEWNDSVPSAAIAVYIDFQRVAGGGPYIPQVETGDVPKAWTRLNVHRPRDGLFIGGFIRSQGVADAGVFKWFSNTATSGAAGKAITVVSPSIKRILANATIDELVTYTGTFQSARNYYGSGSPGYFSIQSGEYANLFEVPLPPDVDYVLLRSFDWTGYYPTFFTTREGQPLPFRRDQTMRCQLSSMRLNIAPFQEPWRGTLRNAPNPVANKILTRQDKPGLLGNNAELTYQFTIPPARVAEGSLAGGAVASPVLDDVTLTYFLSNPKILLQEEAEME